MDLQLIYTAIKERNYINFKFKGVQRTKVQPVAVGFTSTGKLCLRGFDSDWKLFDTKLISQVELGASFSSPKAFYNWSGDKQLTKIVIKL